ncbi:hypothetical protein C1H46_028637 [Malus baccata]|uniref:Aquaporin n=1 Tax=Malus baccata TaxID=106549 RepID=A0A540LH79_MALBA|nr:hypothetical protein C1H46_028637 [Malus baccata]
MSFWVVGPTLLTMATPRVMALELRLLVLLSLFTLSSPLLMPRGMPETLMSLWYIPEFGFSEIMFKWVYNSIQAALMDEIVIGSSQWDCKIYHFSSSVNPGETMMLAMCLFLFVSGALKVENSAVTQKILAPLPIGFAVFLVHLATIPITGTGINPARSLGAAIVYNKEHAWDDHWIFWVGPFIGAALAAIYHQIVIRAIPFKSRS